MISKYIGGYNSIFFDNFNVESLINTIKDTYNDLESILPFTKARKLVRVLLEITENDIKDDYEIDNFSIGAYECHGVCGVDNQPDIKMGELCIAIPIHSVELTKKEEQKLLQRLTSDEYRYLFDYFKGKVVEPYAEFEQAHISISNHTLYLELPYSVEFDNFTNYDY